MAVPTRTLANAIRALAMDAVEAANSGHPGMPMGMADAATVLWTEYLKHDPADPKWPDRDRFVLSAGHGSMLIYALLHLTGYARPTIEDIRGFRQLGSPCAGHPENFLLDGVEATTGPLGQGLAMAVGMAIAERHLNAEFGDDLVDHRTWVVAGDGCLMEGVNHEAAGLAGHLGLGRLIVFWDDNRITIDGATDLSTSEDIEARYAAYGWHIVRCDGHDADDVRRAHRRGAGRSAPVADRLPHDHRLGRAQQAGHRRHPRRRARRRRGRRGARGSWAGTCRRSRFPAEIARGLARGGRRGARGACANGSARLAASAGRRRIQPPDGGRAARGLLRSTTISTA